jgi:hypothetical protein
LEGRKKQNRKNPFNLWQRGCVIVTPAGVDIALPNNSSVTVGSAPKGITTTTTKELTEREK